MMWEEASRRLVAERRLRKEAEDLRRAPLDLATAAPSPDDLLSWTAVVRGPPGTPYHPGVFNLSLTFTSDYPFRPPSLYFTTPILHPNVYSDGRLQLNCCTIEGQWNPGFPVSKILIDIPDIIVTPSRQWLNYPGNCDLADWLRWERAGLAEAGTFNHAVRQHVCLHALPDITPPTSDTPINPVPPLL